MLTSQIYSEEHTTIAVTLNNILTETSQLHDALGLYVRNLLTPFH